MAGRQWAASSRSVQALLPRAADNEPSPLHAANASDHWAGAILGNPTTVERGTEMLNAVASRRCRRQLVDRVSLQAHELDRLWRARWRRQSENEASEPEVPARPRVTTRTTPVLR